MKRFRFPQIRDFIVEYCSAICVVHVNRAVNTKYEFSGLVNLFLPNKFPHTTLLFPREIRNECLLRTNANSRKKKMYLSLCLYPANCDHHNGRKIDKKKTEHNRISGAYKRQ